MREARNRRGWTQQQAAARLGVSQSYLSMLEKGERPLPDELAGRVVRVYGLDAASLPAPADPWTPGRVDSQSLAEWLAALGYPGFSYLRTGRVARNPAEVLLTALAQPRPKARIFEALPWLLLRYWKMNTGWLASHARLHNLQNRLGFVVSLAKKRGRETSLFDNARDAALEALESGLRQSLLAREDGMEESGASGPARTRLRRHRGAEARQWNVLAAWRPEHLRYVE